MDTAETKLSQRLQNFINLKKTVALIISIVFGIVAVISLGHWLNIVLNLDGSATNYVLPNVNSVFYHDYFLILTFLTSS